MIEEAKEKTSLVDDQTRETVTALDQDGMTLSDILNLKRTAIRTLLCGVVAFNQGKGKRKLTALCHAKEVCANTCTLLIMLLHNGILAGKQPKPHLLMTFLGLAITHLMGQLT